jgi:hypothetical protein
MTEEIGPLGLAGHPGAGLGPQLAPGGGQASRRPIQNMDHPAGDPGRAILLAAGVARTAPVEAADRHDALAGGPGVEAQGIGGRRSSGRPMVSSPTVRDRPATGVSAVQYCPRSFSSRASKAGSPAVSGIVEDK